MHPLLLKVERERAPRHTRHHRVLVLHFCAELDSLRVGEALPVLRFLLLLRAASTTATTTATATATAATDAACAVQVVELA